MGLVPHPLGEPCSLDLPPTFSISTWNVWFDKHHREERFAGLLDILHCHTPEIMAFQEVTLPFVRAVLASPWLRQGYWISALDHNNLGTVLLARARPLSLRWVELPSAMGRRLLLAEFAGGLSIGVAHLESLANEKLRQQQLQTAFAVLKKSPRSILLGDFNFADHSPEAKALDPAFQDAWPTQHDTPGYTRDTIANPMARFGRQDKQQRLDRILLRGLSLKGISMLGREPLREGLFPSDHYGLLARLETDATPREV